MLTDERKFIKNIKSIWRIIAPWYYCTYYSLHCFIIFNIMSQYLFCNINALSFNIVGYLPRKHHEIITAFVLFPSAASYHLGV